MEELNVLPEVSVEVPRDAAIRTRIDPRSGNVLAMHSAPYWRDHEERRIRAGLSIREYSELHGLALSTFRRWSSKLAGGRNQRRRAPGTKSAVPATASQPAAFLSIPIRQEPACVDADVSVQIVLGADVQVTLTGPAATRVIEAVMLRMQPAR